eukprot:CAMPEP_0113676734 /NCGR_PEP_ID=MMETSP0038_2-20120614/8826_1 /TAXON_ID=2898 /ORGANISM="Cryptomonas paramecium" /LENGTH=316 /DNA_ID=CAMNT_0000593833 /DNA_START=57 /DNA_END=1004 /DNA_ORIENTATION=- /assembly_acc=CAM_ASM_000170
MTEAAVPNADRKRKRVSEAEEVAFEMAKISWRTEHKNRFVVKDLKICFDEGNAFAHSSCCSWKDRRTPITYCESARLRFESHLPKRAYLTRFVASCPDCYPSSDPEFHLYCSFCNEVVCGATAGPGGKITDHLITIRHIYHEAAAVCAALTQTTDADEAGFNPRAARDYLRLLRAWARKIRFPPRCPVKPDQFTPFLQVCEGSPFPMKVVDLTESAVRELLTSSPSIFDKHTGVSPCDVHNVPLRLPPSNQAGSTASSDTTNTKEVCTSNSTPTPTAIKPPKSPASAEAACPLSAACLARDDSELGAAPPSSPAAW